MNPIRLRALRWTRAVCLVGTFAAAGTVAACKEFLTADNPAAVPVERLEDTALVDLMMNSVVAAFQGVGRSDTPSEQPFFWLTYLSAIYTDELRNHHVFFEEGLYDQRRVFVENSYNSVFTYSPLQRARWLADSVAGRIRALYADSALKDIRLARVYAIGGYTLVFLAEMFCEAPVPTQGERYAPLVGTNELFTLAEQRFDSAIKIANAARPGNAAAGTTLGTAYALGADSIRNLALVGKARAALGRGDFAGATSSAQQVTGMGSSNDFEYRMYYNSNTALNVANLYQERLSGSAATNAASISGTSFFNLDDPRVPHPRDAAGNPTTEATQSGQFVIPNSPPSHSTFNGTRTGADFSYGGSIRLASLLEARYIIAEAGGATGTNLGGVSNIAFVESRRTAFPSTTAATPTTAANYTMNLMEQRRRDFYLDGHRMGDLRRYVRLYQNDQWPRGIMYPPLTTTYNDQFCWPLNVAEITNNPMIPRPYTPPSGP